VCYNRVINRGKRKRATVIDQQAFGPVVLATFASEASYEHHP
jgi:hypothetical protein